MPTTLVPTAWTVRSNLETPADSWSAELASAALLRTLHPAIPVSLLAGLADADGTPILQEIVAGGVIDTRAGTWTGNALAAACSGRDAIARLMETPVRMRFERWPAPEAIAEDPTAYDPTEVFRGHFTARQIAQTLFGTRPGTMAAPLCQVAGHHLTGLGHVAGAPWILVSADLRTLYPGPITLTLGNAENTVLTVDWKLTVVQGATVEGVTQRGSLRIIERVNDADAAIGTPITLPPPNPPRIAPGPLGEALELVWLAPDYQLMDTFDAQARALDVLRALVEPFQGAALEPYRVDIYARGHQVIVKQRDLEPVADVTLSIHDTRVETFSLEVERLPLIRHVRLEGAPRVALASEVSSTDPIAVTLAAPWAVEDPTLTVEDASALPEPPFTVTLDNGTVLQVPAVDGDVLTVMPVGPAEGADAGSEATTPDPEADGPVRLVIDPDGTGRYLPGSRTTTEVSRRGGVTVITVTSWQLPEEIVKRQTQTTSDDAGRIVEVKELDNEWTATQLDETGAVAAPPLPRFARTTIRTPDPDTGALRVSKRTTVEYTYGSGGFLKGEISTTDAYSKQEDALVPSEMETKINEATGSLLVRTVTTRFTWSAKKATWIETDSSEQTAGGHLAGGPGRGSTGNGITLVRPLDPIAGESADAYDPEVGTLDVGDAAGLPEVPFSIELGGDEFVVTGIDAEGDLILVPLDPETVTAHPAGTSWAVTGREGERAEDPIITRGLVPVRVEFDLSNDPTAEDLEYANPRLPLAALQHLGLLIARAHGRWRHRISTSGVPIQGVRRGTRILFTGLVDAEGTPIPLLPALVLDVAQRHGPEEATMALELAFWKEAPGS